MALSPGTRLGRFSEGGLPPGASRPAREVLP